MFTEIHVELKSAGSESLGDPHRAEQNRKNITSAVDGLFCCGLLHNAITQLKIAKQVVITYQFYQGYRNN